MGTFTPRGQSPLAAKGSGVVDTMALEGRRAKALWRHGEFGDERPCGQRALEARCNRDKAGWTCRAMGTKRVAPEAVWRFGRGLRMVPEPDRQNVATGQRIGDEPLWIVRTMDEMGTRLLSRVQGRLGRAVQWSYQGIAIPMTSAQCRDQLSRAGWLTREAECRAANGGTLWVVLGVNNEIAIKAEGSTSFEAWSNAVDQAWELGMLGEVDVRAAKDRRKW
jgi:hypothetical protein